MQLGRRGWLEVQGALAAVATAALAGATAYGGPAADFWGVGGSLAWKFCYIQGLPVGDCLLSSEDHLRLSNAPISPDQLNCSSMWHLYTQRWCTWLSLEATNLEIVCYG
jgi:hypothetical protein